MNKRLIVNADDFGMDPYCSEAIIELASLNLLSSTTILANLCSQDYLNAITHLPISTGIHVNLIEGKPLSSSEKVTSLIDKNGYFKSSARLLFDFVSGKINSIHIENEITAQYNYLKSHGVNISHADSHQHIHIYPYLGSIILAVLKKLGCQKIRSCHVTSYVDMRMAIVKIFQMIQSKELDYFAHPDGLVPTFSTEKNATLKHFENSIHAAFKNTSTIEFMTHPATENNTNSYLNKKAEYDFWKNEIWKEYLLRNDIELINYHQL